MPRRRRRPREEGGGSDTPPSTPVDYLAVELLGNNPRLGLNDKGATLKVELAANVKTFYSQRGERKALPGTLGAALVLEDPNESLDFDDEGRLRIRVFSADELEAFAWRLLRYAQLLRVANALGADYSELREAYWGEGRGDTEAGGGRGRGRRGRRGGSGGGGEEEAGSGDFEVDEIA